MRWYHLAADQGDVDAQTILGNYYAWGNIDSETNEQRAIYFHLAAKNNVGNARACLGKAYEQGLGVLKSGRRAMNLYRTSYLPTGLLETARCYEQGIGCYKNEKEAVALYTSLLNISNPNGFREQVNLVRCRAQLALARCYEQGIGVGQNKKEAICLYEKVINENHLPQELIDWVGNYQGIEEIMYSSCLAISLEFYSDACTQAQERLQALQEALKAEPKHEQSAPASDGGENQALGSTPLPPPGVIGAVNVHQDNQRAQQQSSPSAEARNSSAPN